MNHNELTYRVAFASIRGMNVDLATKLLEVVGNEHTFFAMSEKELRSITQSRSKIYSDYYRRQQLERAQHEVEFIASKQITTHYYTDETYPRRLKESDDAPVMLYSAGKCDLNVTHIISVVGTRHATAYGTNFCNTFMCDLAAKVPDAIIVSGLAYGIDIATHRAAVKNDLKTVAVLPRGLNHIYPANHRNDAINIIHHGGAIITDYLSSDEVHKGNFIARNRIIAGLSDCTIVVESAASGGALVTASLAASYNRDVMALPGRISDEFSTGCNRLIRNNQASVITCVDDLLYTMNWDAVASSTPQPLELFPKLTQEEQMVIDTLRTGGDMHINDIAMRMGIPIYRAMSTLVSLDCRGLVSSLPGSRYSIAIK